MPPLEPTIWSDEDLARDAKLSQAAVIDRILDAEPYQHAFAAVQESVDELLRKTESLTNLTAGVLMDNPGLVEVLRFCFGPPLSSDILKEQVGGSVSVKRLPRERAEAIVAFIGQGIDPLRFPWLADDRPPRDDERGLAAVWTAALMAVERARTDARIRPSREQEARIKEMLQRAGMVHVKKPRGGINLISDLEQGTFTDETTCGTRKADIPGRLFDGRLLLIEAKVSNTVLNSHKRLINDSCTKAPRWREKFGEPVVPISVISGAFSLDQLRLAQGSTYRMYLVWEHKLEVLRSFVENTRSGIVD